MLFIVTYQLNNPPTKSPTSFAFLSGRFNDSSLNISPVAPIVLNPPFTNCHQPTTRVNNVLEIVFIHFLRHFDTNLLLRFIWVQNSDVFFVSEIICVTLQIIEIIFSMSKLKKIFETVITSVTRTLFPS